MLECWNGDFLSLAFFSDSVAINGYKLEDFTHKILKPREKKSSARLRPKIDGSRMRRKENPEKSEKSTQTSKGSKERRPEYTQSRLTNSQFSGAWNSLLFPLSPLGESVRRSSKVLFFPGRGSKVDIECSLTLCMSWDVPHSLAVLLEFQWDGLDLGRRWRFTFLTHWSLTEWMVGLEDEGTLQFLFASLPSTEPIA